MHYTKRHGERERESVQQLHTVRASAAHILLLYSERQSQQIPPLKALAMPSRRINNVSPTPKKPSGAERERETPGQMNITEGASFFFLIPFRLLELFLLFLFYEGLLFQ